MTEAAADELDLAGDGRCHSPGHSAKYLTCSVFDTKTNRILHCQQVQVLEVSKKKQWHDIIKSVEQT